MAQVKVDLGARSYDVHIADQGFSLLAAEVERLFGARKTIVVTEDVVGPLWADAVITAFEASGQAVSLITLPSGEQNKTLETWMRCVDDLLAASSDRSTPVVALGGGVLGDLVGFACASVMRGVPFVQVPTTLLSMADSSVGGKTAVNHRRGKNLVGSFYQPSLVYACLETLQTLPARELSCGLAEILKIGLISDGGLFQRVKDDGDRICSGDFARVGEHLHRAITLKSEIVADDETERGRRAVLNLGHTVAHGLEAALGGAVISHGEAVALGLLAETRWAISVGLCTDAAILDEIEDALRSSRLPTRAPAFSFDEVFDAMLLDKKAMGAMVKVPVLESLGRVLFAELPKNELRSLVRFVPV